MTELTLKLLPASLVRLTATVPRTASNVSLQSQVTQWAMHQYRLEPRRKNVRLKSCAISKPNFPRKATLYSAAKRLETRPLHMSVCEHGTDWRYICLCIQTSLCRYVMRYSMAIQVQRFDLFLSTTVCAQT